MTLFLRQLTILVWKDILLDFRSKENFLSMFFFSVLTLLLFIFAMGDDLQQFRLLIPGIMWMVFLMAGVLGLGKAFSQEVENRCMEGLLLAPVDRSTLFLGKMLSSTFFMFLVQCFTFPLFILFFDLVFLERWAWFLLVLFCGTIGFSTVGTVLAAMTVSLRGREALLPILLFPLITPHLISVVKITSVLFFDTSLDAMWPWWNLLLSFDVILSTASFLTFEFVVEE